MALLRKNSFRITLTAALLMMVILWGAFLVLSPARLSFSWALLLSATGILLIYLSLVSRQPAVAFFALIPLLAGSFLIWIHLTRLLWRLSVIGLTAAGITGLVLLGIEHLRGGVRAPTQKLFPGLTLLLISFFGLLGISIGSTGVWFHLGPAVLLLLWIFVLRQSSGEDSSKYKE